MWLWHNQKSSFHCLSPIIAVPCVQHYLICHHDDVLFVAVTSHITNKYHWWRQRETVRWRSTRKWGVNASLKGSRLNTNKHDQTLSLTLRAGETQQSTRQNTTTKAATSLWAPIVHFNILEFCVEFCSFVAPETRFIKVVEIQNKKQSWIKIQQHTLWDEVRTCIELTHFLSHIL